MVIGLSISVSIGFIYTGVMGYRFLGFILINIGYSVNTGFVTLSVESTNGLISSSPSCPSICH